MQKLISNNKQKFCFIGLSIGTDASSESGIAVLDRDLKLIKTDKAYNLNEIKLIVSNIAPSENTIVCIDLPRNTTLLTGKWRISSKQTQILKLNNTELPKSSWKTRFSTRGSELCSHFTDIGMDVYRYNPYFTINMLKLNSPYKSRSPAACKFLQIIIEEKLKISGIPSNLLPLPTLQAIIGAFIGWKISTGSENTDYRQIGVYKDTPIVSAVNI